MAEKKIALLESYLSCHVCSETFREPVSLSCSHSFCSDCLEKFWEKAKNKNCPICKRKWSKDNTVVNFTLKDLADSFAGRLELSESAKGDRKVELACGKHQEEPQWFCEDDQRAICTVCEFTQHQTHKVVSVEQAFSDLKGALQADLEALQDKKSKYQRVEKTINEMVEHCDEQLLSTERQIRAEFNRLYQFLKEEEDSRLAALKEEEQRKRRTLGEEMKTIQDQLSSLSDSVSTVEAELQKDNLSFLSSYKDTQTAARGLSSLPDPQPTSGALIDVAKHLGNLSFNIWKKMKGKVHFSPVILDPNIAAYPLYLSDDLTSVRFGDTEQQLPDNPERFTRHPFVLGSKGFSSGKHTWQVEVGDYPHWFIGVAKESVDRKGVINVLPEHGIWSLKYLNGQYLDAVGQPVSVKRGLQGIIVQLDYGRGELSFYDSEDKSLICSHTVTFTEKLFPCFYIGLAGEAKTADIKICQVDRRL